VEFLKRNDKVVRKKIKQTDKKMKKVAKHSLENYTRGGSYCQITEDVWLGNMGAAVAIATKDITKFGGVLNISACETWGLSLETQYKDIGVAYRTLAIPKYTMAMRDGPFMSKNVAIKELSTDAMQSGTYVTEISGVILAPGEMNRYIFKQTVVTASMFRYLMCIAAEYIEQLISESRGKPVFVHCVAGVNRSASAIVAYLMRKKCMTHEDAVSIIRTSAMSYRKTNVLTNSTFVDALQNIHIVDIEKARKEFETEHNEIVAAVKRNKQLLLMKKNKADTEAAGGGGTYTHHKKSFSANINEWCAYVMHIAGVASEMNTDVGCSIHNSTTSDDDSSAHDKKKNDVATAITNIIECLGTYNKIGRECCHSCGATDCILMTCGGCMEVYYCTRKCQFDDIRSHMKSGCKGILVTKI
jgi:hypothetical protein